MTLLKRVLVAGAVAVGAAGAAMAQPAVGALSISGGATTTANGSVINFGQPLIGVSSAGPVQAKLGIIPCLGCRADWDNNGSLQPADVAAFVSAWSASLQGGTLAADFDGNGAVQPADVAAFVSAWFAALTGGC